MSEDTWDDGSPIGPVPIERGRQIRAKKTAAIQQDMTELRMSERLVERFGGDLRYCNALGGWHIWTGTHWALDEKRAARERAKDIARQIAHEAAEAADLELFRAAKRAGSSAGVSAILDLASSVPGVVFAASESNRDPWALNCTNGTLDLRTGVLRKHDRAEVITRCCPVAYDPNAKAPFFEKFLEEIQPDPEVRSYLSRLLGYAANGVVREHILGVLWGTGQNGKSVLADCCAAALGDYARPGPTSLIVVSKSSEPHPGDVATCAGSRLVLVHETKRGAEFDSSKVKLLTGGDLLTARFMRQDFFVFSPSHTLVMLTNYKPQADGADAALWRRVQLVPFDVVIPDERKDTMLKERIVDNELAGVLRWLVAGGLEWQRIGLCPPKIVREQTEQYRSGEDSVSTFLEERCNRAPGLKQPAGPLYAAYKAWCGDSGARAMRSNDFGAELSGRGIEKTRTSNGAIYHGIGLRASESGDRWSDD
jgi:putative DNA primase/helicase